MVFSPNQLPPAAQQSFANHLNPWEVTAVAAMDHGVTDRNTLADIAFYHHHRDLIGRALSSDMANFDALSEEWTTWRAAVNTMFGPGYGSAEEHSKPAAASKDRDDKILAANVDLARSAVTYTKSVLPLGAGNRLEDVVDSAGLSILGSIAAKLGGGSIDVGARWNINEICTLARYARAAKAGNCGEQSAVAFVFLHFMGIRPIDILNRVNADHQFVVIGRTGLAQHPADWGPHAAVCDPWMGKAYPAHQIGVYMGPNVRTFLTIRAEANACKVERN